LSLKHETVILKAYFRFLTTVKKELYDTAERPLGIVANVFVFSADLNYFMALLYSSFGEGKARRSFEDKNLRKKYGTAICHCKNNRDLRILFACLGQFVFAKIF
jgi:hypothetical protein